MTAPVAAPIYKSRTAALLALLIAGALLRVLGKYLPAEFAKPIADALTTDVMAYGAVLLSTLAIYTRARIGKKLIPDAIPPIVPLALALALILYATACASAWPSTCTQAIGDGRIGCQCQAAEIRQHKISRRIDITCDGVALPFVVSYTSIEAP